ncbi:MAG: DUF4037 domain-containing protein [Armatimonadota bacterium]
MIVPDGVAGLVGELLPLVRRFSRGEYAIALGGAHAKGSADTESDLDLYLFANSVLPTEERTRMVTAFSPEVTGAYSWQDGAETGTDFYFRGTRVEVWLRNADHIERTIAECQQGTVRRQFVTWTTTGFYNHCALSDVSVMVPLEDSFGIIARWKAQLSVYPPKLREAIIEQHLGAARFWPGNFHYRSAVERGDVIYATGIVQQVVHNVIQVLFALNERYFPGDKHLGAALDHLPWQPADLRRRVESLLWPSVPATGETLRAQAETLRSLLRDVERAAAGPGRSA